MAISMYHKALKFAFLLMQSIMTKQCILLLSNLMRSDSHDHVRQAQKHTVSNRRTLPLSPLQMISWDLVMVDMLVPDAFLRVKN